jgi:protoporphyrinogen oxidase
MRAAVVGGGVMGLSTAHYLAREGFAVTLLEAEKEPGGLASPAAYPGFVWDRFYHCILPSDASLLALLDEIGLGAELRWRNTHTGFFVGGSVRPMDHVGHLLRFPSLSLVEKLRLGLMMTLAIRGDGQDPSLDVKTSEEWLRHWCGEGGWRKLWKHLLRAKLGEAASAVSARFIWSTLRRMASARKLTSGRETLGYVRGGYSRILGRLRERLAAAGVEILPGSPVTRVSSVAGSVCVEARGVERLFDAAFLTVPSPVVSRIVPDLPVELGARLRRTSYLGAVCTVVIGESPLSRNYVLNLAEPGFRLTGVIEMTNLVTAAEETASDTLVYLPRYALAGDPVLERPDGEVRDEALDDLARVYPHTRRGWVRHTRVHRASMIQPVPLAGGPPLAPPFELPVPGVFVVNSAQLPSCVLNNSDCIGLARERTAMAAALLLGRPRQTVRS